MPDVVTAEAVPVSLPIVSRSTAVAPASVYVLPSSTVAGLSPRTVIVGPVVSTTFTVRVAVPSLL